MMAHSGSLKQDSRFDNIQEQMVLEKELQQFFKMTPPFKIEGEFSKINGAVNNQFIYLNLALKVIEELDVEPVQAFGLLEAIRPIIYEKVDIITSRFFGKTIINNSKIHDVLFEAIDLFARLTATYDSVIDEARYFGESQTFIMGSAIHRALSDKARLILCYMQLYQEVPTSVWRHVNGLYRTADEFNLFNQVMVDKLAFKNHSLTVRQLYLYIMLLASAGVRNINSEEIAALAELLKDWVKQVSIKKLEENSSQVVLCMDPEKFITPVFSCQLQDRSSKSLFYIDLTKLYEKLQRCHLHQKFVHGVRYSLSPWTADKINNNWSQYTPREQLRHSGEYSRVVNIYVGLFAIWRIKPASWLSMDNTGFSDRTFRDKKLDLHFTSEALQFDTLSATHCEEKERLPVRVIDHSNTGYCLQWRDIPPAKVAVDEILLVEDEQDHICRLGQVIWIKGISRSEYQSGIAIIASEVIPIQARAISATFGGQPEKTARGFILSHTLGDKKHYGILLEQASWRTGTVLELIQNHIPLQVRLLEPLNQNNKYQSFNIAFFRNETGGQPHGRS